MTAQRHDAFTAPELALEEPPFITLPFLPGGIAATPLPVARGAAGQDPAAGETLPLAPAAPVPVHAGQAIEAVLAERLRQVTRWGHTAEKDAEQPLLHFLRTLADTARGAIDDFQCSARDAETLERIRDKRLVRLGALTLAAIDRLALEIERKRAEEIEL